MITTPPDELLLQPLLRHKEQSAIMGEHSGHDNIKIVASRADHQYDVSPLASRSALTGIFGSQLPSV